MQASGAKGSRMVALAVLLLVSLMAGVLIAGLIAPVLGGLGLGTRALADSITLPIELQEPPLAQRTRILAADGSLIADFYDENRVEVTISDVPTITKNALLAVEDSRFYEHHGVDAQGILRALVKNSASGDVQGGGSTITQQYVKNVLFNSASTPAERAAAIDPSFKRKIREARYALALEKKLTKNQILERYLNIAYFGAGAYGVGTASQRYFSKPVSQLTLSESAMLMGLVQNPSSYDPTLHPQAALTRRDIVLQRMLDVRYITQAQHDAAKAQPLGLKPKTIGNGCSQSKFAGFCHYVEQTILDDPQFGATRQDRQNMLLTGGVTIKTTLDPKMQVKAQAAIDDTIAPQVSSPEGRIGAALATVQPGTGNVLALAQNEPYGSGPGQTTILYSTGTGARDAAGNQNPGNQAGSTFKLFTLIAALEKGMPLSLKMYAPARYTPDPTICDAPSRNGKLQFSNAGDSEAGTFDMWTGTAHSVNTYFVKLEERLGGIKGPVDVARRLGVNLKGANAAGVASPKSCSFTLGTSSQWPLTMAEAYATVAARGKYCKPRVIDSIQYPDGTTKLGTPPQCSQAIAQNIADTVANVLRGPIETPGATANGNGQIGRPAAGKTGTTDDSNDAWFVGFTPELSTAVWLGHTDSRAVLDKFRTLHPSQAWGPSAGATVYGGGIPTIIWRKFMIAALSGLPPSDFPPFDPTLAHGQSTTVPSVTGLMPDAAAQSLQDAGLSSVVAPAAVPSTVAKGLVAATDPPSGGDVPTGTLVTIYLSNGVAPTPSPTPSPTSTSPTPSSTGSGSPTPSSSVTDGGTPTPPPPPASPGVVNGRGHGKKR
ncbi:MAG: hypothetical protein QOI42_529 [Frankiaceae bacterium]|nr:hypothetical protein [Frankiaceae bacterium]